MASTSFNICNDKRNGECFLKQSLNTFELIQHRFSFDSTCFNMVERVGAVVGPEVANGFNIAIQQNQKPIRVETCNARSQLPNIQWELIG